MTPGQGYLKFAGFQLLTRDVGFQAAAHPNFLLQPQLIEKATLASWQLAMSYLVASYELLCSYLKLC